MIIFTEHALLKLKQREIKKDLVLETLKKPEKVLLSRNDRKIALKKFGKLYLKVVFRQEEKNIVVITQHWDSDIK
ncbi:MAG: DUF4258 domain-containing protein [Candidatus Pacebacteria bacterium]|nr:DUF4258 domain-containing protein [Candidatus Paceibacterota bacterium]